MQHIKQIDLSMSDRSLCEGIDFFRFIQAEKKLKYISYREVVRAIMKFEYDSNKNPMFSKAFLIRHYANWVTKPTFAIQLIFHCEIKVD